MDSLLADINDSLSLTRKSLRNKTIEARRRAAAFDGSVGRLGVMGNGFKRGVLETIDLGIDFEGLEVECVIERLKIDVI